MTSQVPEWMSRAECIGADIDDFYTEGGRPSKRATRFCRRCVVIVDCLTFALDHREPYGIWGGMAASARRDLLARRGA